MRKANRSGSFHEYQYTINIIRVPDIDGHYEDADDISNENDRSDAIISTDKFSDDSLPTVLPYDDDNITTVLCYNESFWQWSPHGDVLVNGSLNNEEWAKFPNFTACYNKSYTDPHLSHHESQVNWWGLVAILVVLLTTLGNILVILAISWDRRLQNMTNYFLLSLAVTDLMVAIFVMPAGIVVLVLGRFPFSSEFCLVWISFDVLFCSASIMHLCTISVDRFLSLRYPMKFGRHKTRKRVVLKLVLVWCLSLATSMPLSLMYAADTRSTIVDGVCQIPVSLFQIIGSVFAFYVPLVIMLVTYALTVRLLSQKESELLAGIVDTPVTPLSHSVRLKRLLCKTTSTLSSTTATSIADTELSETVPSEDVESEGTNSPSRRAQYVRYSSHYQRSGSKGHRNYSVREPKGHSQSTRPSFDCHLRPPLSSASVTELSVYPKYNQEDPHSYSGTPKKKYRKSSSNGTRGSSVKSSLMSSDVTKSQINRASVKKRCDKGHNVEIRISDSKGHTSEDSPLHEDQDSEGLNGTPVNVPCSCAPRFFLEGLSKNTPSTDGCGERSCQYEGLNSRRARRDIFEEESNHKRPFVSSVISVLTICRRKRGDADTELESPWHEGGRNSPCTPYNSEAVIKPKLRSNFFHRSPADTPVASISTPSAAISAGVGGGHGVTPSTVSSRRSTWRARSCTASMRFVSSKRHGRNLRMEQKATKVLGIVFFTFVILWAPFFIINLLLGACPSCVHDIGEDVINFVTWLGYVSSAVNPFFYTFFNKSFREAFVKILKCNLRNKRKYHF